MAEETSKQPTTIVNSFTKGLAKDYIPSLMPDGYYQDAWNAVVENEESHSFGIGNEPSNELCAKLPEGHYPRGHHFLEERDWHIIFSSTDGGFSEIGYINNKTCEYKKIYNDADGCPLEFGQDTWIPIVGKTLQPCNDYIIYWAVRDFYYRLNIDDERHCEIETCNDLLLFRANCIPEVTATAHEKGGHDLEAGAYQYVGQLEDQDGNTTNWFHVGNPVYLGSENNRAGDISEQAVQVEIENFQSDYEFVNIGVVKTIGGVVSAHVITQESINDQSKIGFFHISRDQIIRDLPLAEILTKDPHYIRGADLIQYQGRLYLYNVRGERNLDYQERANAIQPRYKIARVPIRYAHLFSGLRHDEVYAASIHFNYTDGRRTRAFHIPGPGGTAPGGSCVGCEDPNAYNTATGAAPTPQKKTLDFPESESPKDSYSPFNPTDQSQLDPSDAAYVDISGVPVPQGSGGPGECDCAGTGAAESVINSQTGEDRGFFGRLADTLGDFVTDIVNGNVGDAIVGLFSRDDICDCEPGLYQEAWHAFWLFNELCKCENGGQVVLTNTEGLRNPGGLNGNTVTGDIGIRRRGGDDGGDGAGGGNGGAATGATGANTGGGSRGATAGASKAPSTCSSGNCGPNGEDLEVSSGVLGAFIFRNRNLVFTGEPSNKGFSFDPVPSVGSIQGGRADAPSPTSQPGFSPNSRSQNPNPSPDPDGDNEDPGRRTGGEGREFEGNPVDNTDQRHQEDPNPDEVTEEVDPAPETDNDFVLSDYDFTEGGEQPPINTSEHKPYDDPDATFKTHSQQNGTVGVTQRGTGNQAIIDDCEPEVIYRDAECCEVKEIIPCIDAEGELSAWESCETYPLDKKCCPEGDESYVYGDLAGQPIRHLKMPSIAQQPHFISYSSGVKSFNNLQAHEQNNAFARFIWLDFSNIELPTDDELDVPLCEHNPYTINLALRDGSNKSVHSSGMAFGTFQGDVHGETMAFPKHAVNSTVTVDRYVEAASGGEISRRGGQTLSNAWVYHSPDTHFDRPPLNVDRVNFELEVKGDGYQHGLYAADREPGSAFVKRTHRKGRRASYNLNKWKQRGQFYCLEGADYVPADSVLDKADDFGYSLVNLSRESSVYFQTSIPVTNRVWNDRSFFGWVQYDKRYIPEAAADYVTLKHFRPSQYGRLENMSYYPIYFASKEDANSNSAMVKSGDAFINLFTIKRTSYVSDKVYRDIAPDGEIVQGIQGLPIIKNLLKKLFVTIGAEKCGCIPTFGSRDGNVPDDPRVRTNNGIGTNAPEDAYFPQVQTSMVSFITESDVNLGYRGSGDSFAQSTYRDLNGQVIDYTFPGSNEDYTQAWLSRFYATMIENPKYKMVLRVVVNAIFTYVIGFYFTFKGIIGLGRVIGDMVFGFTNSFAALFAAAGFIVLTVLAVAWILFWANTDIDNRFIDELLGIEDCFPDRMFGSSFFMDDRRVGGFEDNWFEYNYDFSRRNVIEPILGLPPNYLTCECLQEKTYAIPYSLPQNPESYVDAYRNFSTTNYLEIPNHTGKFSKMFKRSNRLYVHTSDMIWSVTPSGARRTNGGDVDTIYLNSGGLMITPIEMYQGPEEGIYGLLDPNAARNTGWGFIWPDREARKLFQFNGEGQVEAIGSATMQNWLRENMYFKALEAFPDFDKVDEKEKGGVWYSIGIDHRHNRLLFTKIDFDPKQEKDLILNKDCKSFSCEGREDILLGDPEYFNNVSFTLSYNFNIGNFVSFHSYLPQFYMWNRYDMMSWDRKNGTWLHNVNGDFQKFYDEYYPFIVEYNSINNAAKGAFNSFEWQNTVLDTETLEWDESSRQYITNTREHFTDVSMWNSYQATGLKSLEYDNKEEEYDLAEDISEDLRKIPLEFIMRRWRFHSAFDLLKDKKGPIHINTGVAPSKVDESKIENELSLYDSESFVDNYLTTQLVFFDSDKSNVKFLFKAAFTAADNEEI